MVRDVKMFCCYAVPGFVTRVLGKCSKGFFIIINTIIAKNELLHHYLPGFLTISFRTLILPEHNKTKLAFYALYSCFFSCRKYSQILILVETN